MFLETVSLILKHSDISTSTTSDSVSNNVGSWSNGKQKTAFNFNLRDLLGNKMYDENDMFVLRLNQLSYSSANFPLTPKDQQLVVTLSGLNFINSTYNVATGNSGSKQQMLLINMATAGAVESFSPNIAMCNFGKSSDNITLTIELIRTIDGLAGQYGASTYPHCVYSLDIYPVQK
jgi:hypothetical protein